MIVDFSLPKSYHRDPKTDIPLSGTIMRRTAALIAMLSVAFCHKALWAEDTSPTAEVLQLLTLQAAQAEAVDTLQTTIENTMVANGKTLTTQVEMILDKPAGKARIRHMAPGGIVMADIIADNGKFYIKTRDTWDVFSMPDSLKQQISAMGVDMGALLGGKDGLSAEEKDLNAAERTEVANLAIEDAAATSTAPEAVTAMATSASSETVTTNTNQETRAAKRLSHSTKVQKAFAKRKARLARKAQERWNKAKCHREPASDREDAGHHLKALRHNLMDPQLTRQSHRSMQSQGLTFTAGMTGGMVELELVDATTGIPKQRTRYVPKHMFPGGEHQIPASAKVITDEQGGELVELGTSRVLTTEEQNGVMVATETESINHSALGETKVRSKWRNMRANESIAKSAFERK